MVSYHIIIMVFSRKSLRIRAKLRKVITVYMKAIVRNHKLAGWNGRVPKKQSNSGNLVVLKLLI